MLKKWGVRILGVAGTQAFCQLLNGLAAFLLIHILPKEQYAWFTITATMAAVLNALSDGGIGTAVMSHGGKIWHDRTRLSALIHASLKMLRWLATMGSVIVLPLLIWLLLKQGASWPLIITLAVLCICPQWVATRTAILGIVNRLQSRVWELQASELTVAGSRLALTVLPWLCGLVHVVWAAVAVSASLLLQGVLVRKQVAPLIDRASPPELVEEYRPQVVATVRHMYPSAAFNCVQAHLAVWLLSALGSTSDVADIGALNRLSFLTNLAAAPMVMLAAPAFARCQDQGRLRRLFAFLLLCCLAFFGSLLLAAWFQAPLILKIFGPNYSHLQHELFLVVIGLSLFGLNFACCTLNLAKGWTKHFWLNIPITLTAQMAVILVSDLNTVIGAAWLGISLSAGSLAYNGSMSLIKLMSSRATSCSITTPVL